MKKFTALMFMLTVAFGTMLIPSAAHATQDKVGVCHRTASETNPYVYIEVPADEANGHITGTDKQHSHKVTWPEDGTWRGVEHKAGDERLDYYAASAEECEDTTPVQPEPDVVFEVVTDCGSITRTTTTTPYVWDGGEWVLGEPVVEVVVIDVAPTPETCPKPENVKLHDEGVNCNGNWEVNGFRSWFWFDSFKGNEKAGWYPKDTWSRPIFTDLTKAQEKALHCNKTDKPNPPVVPTSNTPPTLPNTGAGVWLTFLGALGLALVGLGGFLFAKGLDKD